MAVKVLEYEEGAENRMDGESTQRKGGSKETMEALLSTQLSHPNVVSGGQHHEVGG